MQNGKKDDSPKKVGPKDFFVHGLIGLIQLFVIFIFYNSNTNN